MEITGARWRDPRREWSRRATALERLDALLEAERSAGAASFFDRLFVEPVAPPPSMIIVSEVQRSGGTLLSRLLDGHPELHAYPLELYWGSPTEYDWPEIDPVHTDAAAAFRELAAGNAHQIERFTTSGYRKTDRGGGDDRLTFAFSLELQRRDFLRRLSDRRPETRRDLLDAFLASFFTAWLDDQARYGAARFVTGFAKRHNFSPAVDAFFDDYPSGHLLTIVRDPVSWYASAATHSPSLYGDPLRAVELWRASVEASWVASERWPERVLVIGFERLVVETAAVMRAVADRLGIAWNGCLVMPTVNGRAVSSNSSFAPARGIDYGSADRALLVEPATTALIRGSAQDLYEASRSLWI